MDSDIEQHSIPKSVALHLLPGALTMVFYALIGVPFANRIGYPSLFGFLLSFCLILMPFELAYLFHQGKRRNGKLSLNGIVLYQEPVRVFQLALFVVLVFGWASLVVLSLSAIDTFLFNTFFKWIPDRLLLSFDMARYPKAVLRVTALASLLLTGMVGPVIEEFYFRGYLLPRVSRLKGWAPLLTTVLFAFYHFWSPWQAATRIIFVLPMVYAVWWKKNIFIGIWVHCIENTVGLLFSFFTAFA
jgi:membrane protease YdiL (CAAX protease family)